MWEKIFPTFSAGSPNRVTSLTDLSTRAIVSIPTKRILSISFARSGIYTVAGLPFRA